MALQVWQPEKKKDTTGSAFQTIGGIASMIPHPAAKAVGMGLQYVGSQPDPSAQAEKPMAPEQAPVRQDLAMPNRGGAISRREQALVEDPMENLMAARNALASLDIDPAIKERLQKPLDLALQAQRSI